MRNEWIRFSLLAVATACAAGGRSEEGDVWRGSAWLSVKEAPVRAQSESGADNASAYRAAPGTSWFSGKVVNEAEVRRAIWHTTALGVYETYLNGVCIGEEFLKPGFTHVKKTRLSFSYDVTASFRRGKGERNVLTAEVSAGWWRDKIVGFHGKRSAFRGVLKLEYMDGRTVRFCTNTKDWKAGIAGPVTTAAIYDGEEYDARIVAPTIGEGLVSVPEENREFCGEIRPSKGGEVWLRHDLAMRRGPFSLRKGEKLVVDFGQNCAGVPFFSFRAKRGTVLTYLPGEMLNDDEEGRRGCDGPKGSVYRANLRLHESCMRIVYTFRGGGEWERYHPRFTFFGYRYAEISATDDVEIESVESVPVTSITKAMEIGSFETGDKAVNQLVSNVRWGQLSNYLSVPTDCPQRDERVGWMADTQVFADAGAYNADTRSFFSKWMRDVRDMQSETGGFPGVAPWSPCGTGTNTMMRFGWSDAGVIVPWKIWRQFGDRAIVDENWAAMEKFVGHVNETKYDQMATLPENCVFGDKAFQWSDWLSLDKFETSANGNSLNDGILRYGERGEIFIHRPGTIDYWNYLGACYWAMDAGMMKEMALATGRDAAKYVEMEKTAKWYLRTKFFSTADGTICAPYNDMQTPAVFALKIGLVEGTAREKTVGFLRRDLMKRGNVCGFLGSSLLMDVLCENGMQELAVNLLLSHEFPSWLYSVDQGATTIWERWNGWTKERGFGPVGMNSYNHYAYGAVLAWMYRYLAGIAPDSAAPGFRKIVMRPIFDRRLGYVRAAYRSAAGLIRSYWRYEGEKVVWEFTVPPGSVAVVRLPGETRDKEYDPGSYRLER